MADEYQADNIPWKDRPDVNIHTNEFIQQSTINRSLNRLLENDKFIYNNVLFLANSLVVDSAGVVAESNQKFLKIIKKGEIFYIPMYKNAGGE